MSLIACNNEKKQPFNIVTTTSMIEDAVKNVVKDKMPVQSLMGAGVDPHLYKATQSDIGKLNGASVIFYNGLYLEAKFEDILKKMSVNEDKTIVAVTDGIPRDQLLSVAEEDKSDNPAHNFDPHIWFSVELWIKTVEKITETMKKVDATNADFYQQNADAYIAELKKLHTEVGTAIDSIPEQQRVLVTSHDAFSYLSNSYGIKVKGLQGISTVAEYGLKDITNMADFLIDQKIGAVFVESSAPPAGLEAVIEGCKKRGHQLDKRGPLYADAMGKPGTPQGTYIGMVKHNVNLIVEGLR